ncbi:MAG: hypothetical protein JNM80_03940 [Phycisphaerae bacterium]|nr:hypothetical protein [Phycisphaerae bacterium]
MSLKRAVVIQSVLVMVALAGAATAAVLLARQPQPPQPPAPPPPLPTPAHVAFMLHAAGLAPDTLAAAGVTASQTTEALLRVREQLPQLASQFDAAQNTYSAASIEHDRLERLVRSGKGAEQDPAALATARTQLRAAATQRDAVTLVFVQAADLGPEVTAHLAALSDRRGDGLAIPYRAATRPDADWLALRHALASADIHTRLGEDVPQPARAVVLANDALPAVAAARASLYANGAAVNTAWNNAVNQQ